MSTASIPIKLSESKPESVKINRAPDAEIGQILLIAPHPINRGLPGYL